jgi:hypothetical protein
LLILPEDCEAEEPLWLPLLWPAVLLWPALPLWLLEVSGDCEDEDEGVLCATIHAEQANSVRLSKIVFVMV